MSNAEETDEPSTIRLIKGVEFTKKQLLLVLAGIGVLLIIPEIHGFIDNLRLSTTHRGLLFGLAAVGLNILLRHTHLVSFGHAAFFGGGAYTAAVMASYLDVQHGILLILGATFFATLLAVFIGWLVAGHVDIYFALLTLAFNAVLFAMVMGSAFFNYNDGLSVRVGGDRPLLLGMEWAPSEYNLILYYMTLVIILLSLIVMWRIVQSPFGRALDAIGQDRTRALFIGIPVQHYIWIAFTISGLYGGVAGGLFALLELRILPEPTLFVFVSGEILFMAILGGFQTLVGPLIGGIILVYFLDNARFLTSYFNALTGIVLLIIVFVLPKGVVGSAPDIAAGTKKRLKNPGQLGTDASNIGTMVSEALRDSMTTVRILLFGVK